MISWFEKSQEERLFKLWKGVLVTGRRLHAAEMLSESRKKKVSNKVFAYGRPTQCINALIMVHRMLLKKPDID